VRWLALYLRSRSVPVAVAVMVGATLALWVLSRLIDNPGREGTLALLAVLAGSGAFASGLAGADVDLDRTAGIAWPPRRAAHVILAGAAMLGIVAATALTDTATLARNVAGLTGLVALGAVALGATRAWLPSGAWTVLGLWFTPPLGAPPTGPGYKVALTWMAQPASSGMATITAALLGGVGTLAYALLGPRR
jgi:hypothetical protein